MDGLVDLNSRLGDVRGIRAEWGCAQRDDDAEGKRYERGWKFNAGN